MSQKEITSFFQAKQGKAAATKKAAKEDKSEMEEEVEVKKVAKSVNSSTDFPNYEDLIEDLSSWQDILKTYTSGSAFKNTYTTIKKRYAEATCYPPPNEIFNVFKQTPLKSLKVVIVGQDPYHQPGQAMGLCFSVKKGVKIPPSLANMYKSLANDPKISGFKAPNHGDLTRWANQGVFLLNDILTVEDSKPNAHKDSGWANFTSEVIKIINKECSDIVFLLWGAPAQKKASVVDKKKHHILTTTHPSPLSSHRGFDTACNQISIINQCLINILVKVPFSACNAILTKLGKQAIDWQV